MRPVDRAPLALALIAAAALSACGTPKHWPGDDAPTLKSLAGQEAERPARRRLPTSEEQALAAWQALLAAQPDEKQRAQALRRLGDLEMDRSDTQLASADANASPDYRAAVTRYQDYLRAYPQDPGNDLVLYQLARAHEQGGELEKALAVLDQLVQRHPQTRHLDEAQFRRGELLFTARQYGAAEQAYATVLASPSAGVFRDRALYMRGWSLFKLGQLDTALGAFLAVLDGKLAGRDDALPLAELPDLSRGDRELVEDTFRVSSLALENLQGAASIAPLVTTPQRTSYQVRLYQELAALYLKQDRPKDAADTYLAFTRREPAHALAPKLHQRVIEIDREAGFDQLALQAQQDFVTRYGAQGDYRRANPVAWAQTQPQVQRYLAELAQHHHAAAQRSHQKADVQAAASAYQALLIAFPADADAPRQRFLLGELLFEDQRFAEAAATYEHSAYRDPAHPRAADAGYAALLARAEQLKAPAAEPSGALQREQVESSLRFAQAFRTDPRTPPVLAQAAASLLQLGEGARAAEVSQRLLAPELKAPAEPRRVAWNVLATTRFEAGDFAGAEQASREALALSTAAPQRAALTERLAASIYKQGEQARAAGRAAEAAALFERVGEAAPQSPVRVAAQYDAAAQRLTLKDWPAASRLLEDFRQRYPQDPLQAGVPERLALAYREQALWPQAAAEYERIASAATEPERARAARWAAADAQDQALAALAPGAVTSKTRVAATQAWERYLRAHPSPLPAATEARARLAALAQADGNPAKALAWQRELMSAERAGADARTDRSRLLSAQAALALAAPEFEAYRKVALVEPLQKSLATKKARLDEVLKAYARAAEDGVADTVTAATFHTAAIYQDFGKALLDSQRPKKLRGAELEQYNVMLEEQAYPFEEKAIEIHELNARHTTEGLYDPWVQQSLAALRTLRPVRWGKAEREAPASSPVAAPLREAQALRAKGDFAGARKTLEQALAQAPQDPTALINLGVLFDVYLGEPARALPLFERYLALTPAGDAAVTKWVAELKNRKPAAAPAPAPKKES